MGFKPMDKAKYLLNKFLFPTKHREVTGKIDLQSATGELFIPIDFEIADIETDVFVEGDNPNSDFVAPCSPIPNEFIHADIVHNEPNPNQLHLTWAVNSYRTLVWKVSGFTK